MGEEIIFYSFQYKSSFLRCLIKTATTSSTYKSNLWGLFLFERRHFTANILSNDFSLKD